MNIMYKKKIFTMISVKDIICKWRKEKGADDWNIALFTPGVF